MKNHLFKNYKFMMKTIHDASPYRICLTIFFTAISNLFSIFYNVIFLAYLMNAIEKRTGIREVVIKLLIFVVINILFELLNSYYNQVYIPKDDIKLSLYLKKMIYNKILKVDIECFDNAQYYDNVTFALNDLNERVKSILNNLSQFISHALCSVVLIAFFSKVDPSIVFLSMLPVIVGLIAEPMMNKRTYEFRNESIKYDRKFDYVKRISTQYEYAQELRTTNVSKVLYQQMNDAYRNLKQLLNKFYKKITTISCIQELIGFGFTSFLVTLISIYKMVVVKSVSIAMFIPLLGAIAQFTWRASSVIGTFNSILNDNIYLNKFNTFYQYQPKVVSAKNETVESEFQGIELRNVSFRYSEKEEYILKDINMSIKSGQKIALVGYNGAGKTTLINLILRLYDPGKGEILYNNKAIPHYNIKEYQGQYGIVFQDINIYATSIANNISMNSECYSDHEMDQVMKSLKLREKINGFANGYQTQLTHELDVNGEMLSIGQIQCLALARIFINPNIKIYILDEPTSALDPIAEEEIFTSINEYLKDKTVIYISHRFSASKIADKIFLMQEGKIIEEGSHEELMKQNGSYAKMFYMQAKYYKEDVECAEEGI